MKGISIRDIRSAGSPRLQRLFTKYERVRTDLTSQELEQRMRTMASDQKILDRLEETTLGYRDVLGAPPYILELCKLPGKGVMINVEDLSGSKKLRSDILGPEPEDGAYPLWVPNGFSNDPFSVNKILNHPDEVDAYLKDENPAPVTLEIDPTNKCQCRCPECTFKGRDRELSVETGLVIKAIEEIRALGGAKGVTWTGGGEALLHLKLAEMVRRAFELGAENGLITNGISVNNEGFLDEVFPLMRWVRVSLDAGSAEIYKASHGMGAGAFQKVVDNIRLLVAARDRNKLPVSIGISFLTSLKTKQDMLNAAVIAKGIGVDYLQLKPMQIHTGQWRYEYEDPQYVRETEEEISALQTPEFRVFFPKKEFYDMQAWKSAEYCHGQQFSTSIAADGNLYACCHFKGNPDYVIGDLKTRSFGEIWGSERRKEIVSGIRMNKCVPWCKEYQINNLLAEIVKSGKLVKGPVSRTFDGETVTYAQANDYPPVLHHNFL